ncbi:MAG: transporter substrate-binding domain-containing protein [Lachnospiraceae bacterium]|nr:transporter substrate-binding domain-containing protein [Lachnospiraceae bacterium]
MKRKVLAGIISITMVLGLTGCTGAAPAPAADAAAPAAEAKTEEAADASDSDKTWIIATDTAFKPFEYTDANGDFVGIDVDILAAVAEDQGFKYDLQSLGWDASIAACQAGQADGMIAGASITEERKESGWMFSEGYYDANQCMAVEASSDITGFDGLKGKSVAVKTGTMSAEYAESLAGEYDFTVTYFEDSPTMYQAVTGGQVAACFDDTPIMAANIKDGGLSMKLVDGTGNDPAAYGFAIFKDSSKELLDMFNAGLKNIKENGKYDEILAKYLGE